MSFRVQAALAGLAVLLAPVPAAAAAPRPASATPAQAEPPRAGRVVIVVTDRVRVDDLFGIPAVQKLAGSAAFGLLSTAGRGVVTPSVGALSISAGTRAVAPDPEELFLTIPPGPVLEPLAAGTIGDAYRARTSAAPPRAVAGLAVTPFAYPDIFVARRANARADVRAEPGLLGEAVRAAGLRRGVVSLGPGSARLAPLVAMDERGIVPIGIVMDRFHPGMAGEAFGRVLATSDLVAVDAGGLAEATILIPQVLRRLTPEDGVIILAADPPEDVTDAHTWLSPVVARGPGLGRGLLTSASTRRDGVVSNVDVLPTVLGWLGVPVPSGLVGQRFESAPAEDPAGVAAAAFRRYTRLARFRGDTFRALSVVALAGMAAAVVALARGRRGTTALRAVLLAAAGGPLVMLALPPSVLESTGATLAWVLAGALVVGAGTAVVIRDDRVAYALLGGTALVILAADVVLGSRLGARSLLGFTVAGGTRFYGLGSEEMGVALAGLLLALGLIVDAVPRRRRPAYVAAGVAVLVFALPPFGAKFGMVLTAVPALLVAWTAFESRRLTREVVLLGAALVLAGIGIAAATGVVAGGEGSHIGVETRVIGESGAGAAIAVFLRRAGVALRLLGSFWVWLVVAAAAVATLAARPLRDRFSAAVAGRPGLRGTFLGLAAAGGAALLFNDAGAVIVATMTLVAGPAVLASVLTASGQAQAGGPVSTLRRSSSSATRSPNATGAVT